MYPVTDSFLKAIQSNSRSYYWNGKIATTEGSVYEFNEQDIIKGSGYISSQCCDGNEIELGTVYSSEMGITLLSDIDRYSLPDAMVELYFNLKLENGEYEVVPMGIYEVSEANRKRKCLEIKAYDYMLRFDKDFPSTTTIGTAYEIISFCCEACKVEMAQSQAEIESLLNGKELISIYAENDIETYRDVLFYLGQVLGGFFCINRVGKLELRQYKNQAVLDISNTHRFSSSFSDYITRYTAISVTNVKTQTAEYYALDEDNGLTMNIGINPFLQYGLEETRTKLCENILQDISLIEYVPFDAEMTGNPALDLGDIVTFSGGQADETKISCITYSQCRIGGKQTLRCVGKNSKLASAKSKNDKNLIGLMNQIDVGRIGFFTFTNAKELTLSETDMVVANIDFVAKEVTEAEFFGQIILNVESNKQTMESSAIGSITVPVPISESETTDVQVEVNLPVTWQEDGKTNICVKYLLNDIEIDLFYPKETYSSGQHLLALYYPLNRVIPNLMNNFKVLLSATNGQVVIEEGNCIATINGQGLAAREEVEWDGTFTIEEVIRKPQLISTIAMPKLAESINENLQFPKACGVSDSVPIITFVGFSVDFNNGG